MQHQYNNDSFMPQHHSLQVINNFNTSTLITYNCAPVTNNTHPYNMHTHLHTYTHKHTYTNGILCENTVESPYDI